MRAQKPWGMRSISSSSFAARADPRRTATRPMRLSMFVRRCMISSLTSGMMLSQTSCMRQRIHSGICGSKVLLRRCWLKKLSSSVEIHCSPRSLTASFAAFLTDWTTPPSLFAMPPMATLHHSPAVWRDASWSSSPSSSSSLSDE